MRQRHWKEKAQGDRKRLLASCLVFQCDSLAAKLKLYAVRSWRINLPFTCNVRWYRHWERSWRKKCLDYRCLVCMMIRQPPEYLTQEFPFEPALSDASILPCFCNAGDAFLWVCDSQRIAMIKILTGLWTLSDIAMKATHHFRFPSQSLDEYVSHAVTLLQTGG